MQRFSFLFVSVNFLSALSADISINEIDQILNSFASTNHEPCSTRLFANLNLSPGKTPNFLPPWSDVEKITTPLASFNFLKLSSFSFHNNSFFELEWSEDDLNFNSKWLNIRHSSRHCAVGLIQTSSENSVTIRVTNELLFLRILKPGRDYFIFIGHDYEQLHNFLKSDDQRSLAFVSDLKFKYGLLLPTPPVASTNSGPPFALINPCAQPLYATECPPVIYGRHISVTAVFGPQMLRINPHQPANAKNTAGGGIYYDILRAASESYNFTFTVRTSGFRGASGFKKNDTWFGALGEVFKHEADFAVTAGITKQRFHIVEPSSVMCWVQRIFFIRRPPLATKWTAIFKPLELLVWILTFIAIFLSIPLYMAPIATPSSKRTRVKDKQQSFGKDVKSGMADMFSTAAVFYRMILEQSWNEHGRETGFRIRFLITIWALFCLVLTTSYRSKLMNFLTFLTSEPVPETHGQLIAENYKLYFRYYGGVAYAYYQTSKLPMHQQIFRRAILMNTSYDCMIAAALTDRSACLDYDFHGNYAVLTNATLYTYTDPSLSNELFIRSSDFNIPVTIPWCFRKGSPLLHYFDVFILKSLAHGLYDHWLAEDWSKSKAAGAEWMRSQTNSVMKKQLEDTFNNLQSTTKPLNKESLFGLAFLLAGGLGLSLLAWFVEMLKQCCHQKS